MPPPDSTVSARPATYGALLGVPGFPRLVTSLLLGRISGQMYSVGLVLFVLARYHSPQLAGATAFVSLFPGILLSPVGGALLDRYSRTRLVTFDYLAAAAAMLLLASLSAAHELPPSLLLAIVGVASLTWSLSGAGARSLFPTLVPAHLWERANALDNTSWVLASVVGAPLVGTLVGFGGGEWALVATGAAYLGGAIAMATIRDPSSRQRGGRLLEDAWSGLTYVLRNRTLVGLALTFFVFNLGWGTVVIAVPVLVLGQFQQGPGTVGYLWGAVAVAGVIGALISGRIKTNSRERQIMSLSMAGVAVALAVVPLANSVIVVAGALIAVGLVEGPFDVAFLTLRQRRTDPAKFGRMFAVSMALNVVGTPVGSALAAVIIPRSLALALWVAVLAVGASALLPLVAIPAEEAPAT